MGMHLTTAGGRPKAGVSHPLRQVDDGARRCRSRAEDVVPHDDVVRLVVRGSEVRPPRIFCHGSSSPPLQSEISSTFCPPRASRVADCRQAATSVQHRRSAVDAGKGRGRSLTLGRQKENEHVWMISGRRLRLKPSGDRFDRGGEARPRASSLDMLDRTGEIQATSGFVHCRAL